MAISEGRCRVFWLLEELGSKYEPVAYERGLNFLTPPALANANPLGNVPFGYVVRFESPRCRPSK